MYYRNLHSNYQEKAPWLLVRFVSLTLIHNLTPDEQYFRYFIHDENKFTNNTSCIIKGGIGHEMSV
jgi:hypothetical protein